MLRVCTALLTLLVTACGAPVKPTTLSVEDSVRHYNPVLAGTDVDLFYRVTNTGREPLVIAEMLPSCGCIAQDDERVVIPVGQTRTLHFVYHSIKNIGYARHTIRLYGNILPNGVATLPFDINIVSNAGAAEDYEQLYRTSHYWGEHLETHNVINKEYTSE